jgi:hypothetical protein
VVLELGERGEGLNRVYERTVLEESTQDGLSCFSCCADKEDAFLRHGRDESNVCQEKEYTLNMPVTHAQYSFLSP